MGERNDTWFSFSPLLPSSPPWPLPTVSSFFPFPPQFVFHPLGGSNRTKKKEKNIKGQGDERINSSFFLLSPVALPTVFLEFPHVVCCFHSVFHIAWVDVDGALACSSQPSDVNAAVPYSK